MSINGFHHVGVSVTDEAKSLAFYRDGLGGKVVHSFSIGPDKTIYLVDLGNNAVVELIPVGEGEADAKVGWVHIAVATDDTRAAFDAAVAVGAGVQMPPTEIPLGSLTAVIAYILGPDKEIIEYFQVV
jgi:lactoylglutathione lyase